MIRECQQAGPGPLRSGVSLTLAKGQAFTRTIRAAMAADAAASGNWGVAFVVIDEGGTAPVNATDAGTITAGTGISVLNLTGPQVTLAATSSDDAQDGCGWSSVPCWQVVPR